jgi:hypothetical protein
VPGRCAGALAQLRLHIVRDCGGGTP